MWQFCFEMFSQEQRSRLWRWVCQNQALERTKNGVWYLRIIIFLVGTVSLITIHWCEWYNVWFCLTQHLCCKQCSLAIANGSHSRKRHGSYSVIYSCLRLITCWNSVLLWLWTQLLFFCIYLRCISTKPMENLFMDLKLPAAL